VCALDSRAGRNLTLACWPVVNLISITSWNNSSLRQYLPSQLLTDLCTPKIYVKVDFVGLSSPSDVAQAPGIVVNPNALHHPTTLTLIPLAPTNPSGDLSQCNQPLVQTHRNLIALKTSWALDPQCHWEVYEEGVLIHRECGLISAANESTPTGSS
jgi:hypothetical protein